MFKEIKYRIIVFIEGIRNLFKYFNLIWYDRDWDYSFLLDMIEFKIRNMAELHKLEGNSVDAPDVSKELYELADLIQLLNDDEFYSQTGNKLLADQERTKIETRVANILKNYRRW